MSSFAINGRIVFDPQQGPTAFARAVPDGIDEPAETRRAAVDAAADPRLHVFELVAALALEIHRRGHGITDLEVE